MVKWLHNVTLSKCGPISLNYREQQIVVKRVGPDLLNPKKNKLSVTERKTITLLFFSLFSVVITVNKLARKVKYKQARADPSQLLQEPCTLLQTLDIQLALQQKSGRRPSGHEPTAFLPYIPSHDHCLATTRTHAHITSPHHSRCQNTSG